MPEAVHHVYVTEEPRKNVDTGTWCHDFRLEPPITVHKPDFLNGYENFGRSLFNIIFECSDETASYGFIDTRVDVNDQPLNNGDAVRSMVTHQFLIGIKPYWATLVTVDETQPQTLSVPEFQVK